MSILSSPSEKPREARPRSNVSMTIMRPPHGWGGAGVAAPTPAPPTRKTRANLARRQRGSRKVFLMTLSLALGALAIGGTCELGAQCSGEAKVSVERYGPNGSIAEDRPDASERKVAVTLTFRGTCWAAGGFYCQFFGFKPPSSDGKRL